jgi:hypothetical protein
LKQKGERRRWRTEYTTSALNERIGERAASRERQRLWG